MDFVQWTQASPVQDPNNWNTITYKYDPSGRRIEKNVDGYKTRYVYDGGNVIAEYDGNNNLTRKYIHGPCVDEMVCMIDVADSSAVYYYHYNALGSVVALSDSTGDTVQTYEYSVYGQVAASDPNFTANPYMFTGRRFDYETGLYYYRARYYNPYIGRFLQTDPIGYGDGINWYAYCGNNPLNFIDPLGLEIISLCGEYQGTYYNSWGMRITPDTSYIWGTGKDVLDYLVEATETYGEITSLNIFGEGWAPDSKKGYRHRGGIWASLYYDNAGFYGQSRSYDHAESRDLDDLRALIAEGEIKFAEDGVILLTACRAASTGYFSRELVSDTDCTVYAATGAVSEYEIGDDFVRWFTTGTWKKFVPGKNGLVTEVDLGTQVITVFRDNPTPIASRRSPNN